MESMITRQLSIVAVCAGLAACSSAVRHNGAATPTVASGVYAVRATAEAVELRGTMQVVADTIALELDKTECVRDPIDKSNVSIRYRCDPVGELSKIVFDIDRKDPVLSSRWSATALKRTTSRQCTSMTIVNAKEVCVYQDVPTIVESAVYGHLVISREVASAK
jgi:hypothetical protein